MIRSMYSGISGLKNHQVKLDVIGNNISNVNTYGFKKGRTVFKDMISQTSTGASGPGNNTGGINAMQVGLGSQMAAIDTIHNAGSFQTTSRTLDLGISGDGFFMVAESGTPDADGIITPVAGEEFSNIKYTRAGNFYMDKNGYLVNSDGLYLVGITATTAADPDYPAVNTSDDPAATAPPSLVDSAEDEPESIMTVDDDGYTFTPVADTVSGAAAGTAGPIKIPTSAQSMSISQDGKVTFVDSEGVLRWAGQLMTAKFANPGGLEKSGSNYYVTTANSGDPFVYAASSAGIGKIQSGVLEMSNVDLSEEFTEMIVAQRGFQANSRIITTSDQILEELVNLKR